jgi:hypothetical protein
MQAFIIALIAKALQNKEIREFILEFAERIGQFLLPKLAALFPSFAAATGIEILGHLGKLLPGLGSLPTPDLGPAADAIREQVNHALPDGVDIPILSDVVKGMTGFDLSDWLTGRGKP